MKEPEDFRRQSMHKPQCILHKPYTQITTDEHLTSPDS